MKRRTNKKKRGGTDVKEVAKEAAKEAVKEATKVEISYTPFYIALLFALSNLVGIIFQDPPTTASPTTGDPSDPNDPPANPDPPPSKTSQIMGSIAGSIVYLGIIFFLCKSGNTTWAWVMVFGGAIIAVLLILLIGVGLAMS